MKIVSVTFDSNILHDMEGSIDVVIARLEKYNEQAKKEGFVDIKIDLASDTCYSCTGHTLSIKGEREETKGEESLRIRSETLRADRDRERELGQLAHLKKKYE